MLNVQIMGRNAMRASLKLYTLYWLIKEMGQIFAETFLPNTLSVWRKVGWSGQTSLEWLYKALYGPLYLKIKLIIATIYFLQ